MLTTGQVARRWGVEPRQVQRYCGRRKPPPKGLWPCGRTPGGHYRIPLSVVEAFERARGITPAAG